MRQKRRPTDAVASTACWIISVVCVCLCLVFYAVSAIAHKITIFAWVEGDTVHTQSKFSGGKRAKNSTVVVYDKEGNQLLEGKTDENGGFSFQVPKKTELKVVLKASMGHLAEWTIPSEEITEVANVSESVASEVSTDTDSQGAASLTDQGQPIPTAVGLSREEVQALVGESLDRKLAPIFDKLAEALDRDPGVRDIISGIGYIFGLVGVALYFSSRGKRKSGLD